MYTETLKKIHAVCELLLHVGTFFTQSANFKSDSKYPHKDRTKQRIESLIKALYKEKQGPDLPKFTRLFLTSNNNYLLFFSSQWFLIIYSKIYQLPVKSLIWNFNTFGKTLINAKV